MEDLSDVYNELIMEHSMNSYNKKKDPQPRRRGVKGK